MKSVKKHTFLCSSSPDPLTMIAKAARSRKIIVSYRIIFMILMIWDDSLEITLQRRNLTNTLHYSNNDYNPGVSQINFLSMTLFEVNFSQRMSALQNKQKTGKKNCRLLQNTAHQCLISYIFLWTNGILYKTSRYYEKYSKTLPLFNIEKGGLWKMYSSEQNSEVSEFPILTNRSRVWPVYTL